MRELIVILLCLILFVLADLSGSIEEENMSAEARAELALQEKEEKAQAEQRRIADQTLMSTPWENVSQDDAPKWVVLNLFSGWTGVVLFVVVFIPVLYMVTNKFVNEAGNRC